MGPEVAGPSSSAIVPPSETTKGLAMLPPDVSVTCNVRLVERLLRFILQPRDRRERVGRTLGDIIDKVFP